MIFYKYRSGRGTKDSEGKDVFERDMGLLKCVVGTKSKACEHEAEHRLIFDNGGRQLKVD